jgi:EpsD family peptidyl-prolyl cis-trans isomerase
MKNPSLSADRRPNLVRCFNFVAALLLAALVTDCGKGDDKKPATQVAAKVNGHEITIHQVNDILARQNVKPEQAEAAKRQILERLIEQELAKQQAVEKKLDRNPRVVQAMEAAKNDILARAYMDQIASNQPKPSADEVKSFYAEHPELFSGRRIYSIEELTVPQKQAPLTTVKDRLVKSKDLGELAAWLKSQKAEVSGTRGVRAAEQLPMVWLAEMHKMKEGEMRVFENGDRLNIVRLAAVRAAPVDEATASPRIQQYLVTRRLREEMQKDIRQLREKSNIEYAGEFASPPPQAKTAPAPEPFQPAPAEPTQQPPAPNFEKGIRGLR